MPFIFRALSSNEQCADAMFRSREIAGVLFSAAVVVVVVVQLQFFFLVRLLSFCCSISWLFAVNGDGKDMQDGSAINVFRAFLQMQSDDKKNKRKLNHPDSRVLISLANTFTLNIVLAQPLTKSELFWYSVCNSALGSTCLDYRLKLSAGFF